MPECISWIYFAEIDDQALIRVPATGDANLMKRPAERYWGRGNWLARSPHCGNWTDDLSMRGRYREVNAGEVPAIVARIDDMPGGTFRDRARFWPDVAHRWTIQRAQSRTARLEADTGPDSSHWTVQAFNDDVNELERLQDFLSDR
ncbi:hypothetical protein ACIA48_16730 [Mycobacterium sp. NPDC051804]|uniref:hypothetical protein n=1 Tax=Mycobacterium sp. NPDC051804 TaxID=3364295 RepID=UPI00378753AF